MAAPVSERLFAPSTIVCLFSAEHQPLTTSLALLSQRLLGRRLTTPPRGSPPSPALSSQLAARPQAPQPAFASSACAFSPRPCLRGHPSRPVTHQSHPRSSRPLFALLALLAPGRRSQALAYAGARDPLGEGGWESGSALPNWTLESPAETKRQPQSTTDDSAKAGEGGKEGRSHLWLGGTRKHPPDPCWPSAIRATNDRRPACWGLGVRANHRPISAQIAVMDLPPMQAGAKLAPPRPTPPSCREQPCRPCTAPHLPPSDHEPERHHHTTHNPPCHQPSRGYTGSSIQPPPVKKRRRSRPVPGARSRSAGVTSRTLTCAMPHAVQDSIFFCEGSSPQPSHDL